MKFFTNLRRCTFISRPNRFTVVCSFGGRTIKAFLPNPGRLMELLLPGVGLFLEESGNPARKMSHTVVAVEKDGRPVILQTHRTNDIAEWLIERGLVPGLEGAVVVKREIAMGRSRFDLLLRKGPVEIIVEVKSCTLFGEKVAMFPDAVTERGRRHMEELSELSGERTRCVTLFVVYNNGLEYFMPDYHTDLDFAKTFMKVRGRVEALPVAPMVGSDLSVAPPVKLLDIPWDLLEKEAVDSGGYLILMRLPEDTAIYVGALGPMSFKKGFYVYVGSAERGLTRRIERHRRLRKKAFWHIDYLRARAEFVRALPVRTLDDIECPLAETLAGLADGATPGFGSSDCCCASHLLFFNENPLTSPAFQLFVQHFRMDRLFS